jgi:DNA helicase-4
MRGEIVKINAEKIFSNYFYTNNINYVYEPEFFISRSDFYLPDYGVYVEYWGLVDADEQYTRERYIKIMKWKMAQYYKNNIKFVSIYPRDMNDFELGI